jgi:DNA-directed RNA polymerase specialized sigma24 family protein
MNTAAAQTSSRHQAPTPPIDMQRILDLEPTVRKAAGYLARISGEDYQELYSAIQSQIAETAAANPQFLSLSNTDAYIVTFARQRVIDSYRRMRASDAVHKSGGSGDANEIADTLSTDADEPQIGLKLAQFVESLESLDANYREVIEAARRAGDKVFKCNGSLNIKALAQFMGKPERTVNTWVNAMRRQWGTALVAA